jgi:hypothetical protein
MLRLTILVLVLAAAAIACCHTLNGGLEASGDRAKSEVTTLPPLSAYGSVSQPSSNRPAERASRDSLSLGTRTGAAAPTEQLIVAADSEATLRVVTIPAGSVVERAWALDAAHAVDAHVMTLIPSSVAGDCPILVGFDSARHESIIAVSADGVLSAAAVPSMADGRGVVTLNFSDRRTLQALVYDAARGNTLSGVEVRVSQVFLSDDSTIHLGELGPTKPLARVLPSRIRHYSSAR